jgi:hypothetical protein
MSFAVVRHPDIETLGIIPQGAMEYERVRGWYRVSEYRPEPSSFHLPDFDDADEDLDAPPPKKPARKAPAAPEPTEEQEA